MSRLLIIIGFILIILGLFWPTMVKMGIGRFPGDLLIEKEKTRFYFPVVSCILLSAVISIAMWIIHFFQNK